MLTAALFGSLVATVSFVRLTTCCTTPLKVSKEFQITLGNGKFLDHEHSPKQFFQFLNGVENSPAGQQNGFSISLSRERRTDSRLLTMFDTPSHDLAATRLRLKTRKWLTSSEPSLRPTELKLKMATANATTAADLPLQNGAAASSFHCSAKLEQDMHTTVAPYAMTSQMWGHDMLAFVGSNGEGLNSVGRLGLLYPNLKNWLISHRPAVNAATPLTQTTAYRIVVSAVRMHMGGKKVKGALSLTYASKQAADHHESPTKVEYSWRMKSDKSNWSCMVWRASQNIQDVIAASDWSGDSHSSKPGTCDIH